MRKALWAALVMAAKLATVALMVVVFGLWYMLAAADYATRSW